VAEYDLTDEGAQWKPRTLKDAYLDREPTVYIVDKFFASHSLNVIYGAPGVMKSMLMADMCACIASKNHDWLPGSGEYSDGIPVKNGSPVFWLDMDNGTRRTDERFSAMGKQRKMPDDSPLYYLSMPYPSFDASDQESFAYLMEMIEVVEARLVVIDNLALSTGSVEENSAQMAQIMGGYRILAERTGAALVLIHHQRKGGAGGGRAGDALRGHSSIEASLDLALHVVREPNTNEVTVRSTKTRGVDVPMVTARFNYEHVMGTNDLSLAWFDGVPVIRGDSPIRDAIIDTLTMQDGITKGLLADMVHERLKSEVGINKIRNMIMDMIDATGELVLKTGKHNAKIIYIA